MVRVLEDDDEARRLIERILVEAGHAVRTYATAQELVAESTDFCHAPGCVVMELELPGGASDEVLAALQSCGCTFPAVIVTGHDGAERTARAFRSGAIDLVTKPPDAGRLRQAVAEAIERDRRERGARLAAEAARERVGALTDREREVFREVARGRSNREAGASIGIAMKTVEFHRGNMMRKLGAASVAELVLLAVAAGEIEPW